MSNLDWATPDDIEEWSSHRHLIVGQAPSRSATPDTRPWDSKSGRLLAKRAGTTIEEILRLCDTTNLNLELRGTRGKWDDFDAAEARERASALREVAGRWRTILLCGARVVRAMGGKLDSEVWLTPTTPSFGIVHPGGTNRALNDPAKLDAHRSTIRTWWWNVLAIEGRYAMLGDRGYRA
jgi:uracil-DNA glycosylase